MSYNQTPIAYAAVTLTLMNIELKSFPLTYIKNNTGDLSRQISSLHSLSCL